MGRYCLVPSCDSNTKESYLRGNPKKTMFAFPKDTELLEKWKELIPKNFDVYQISKKTVVCEDHFEKKYLRQKVFDSSEGCRKGSHLKRLTYEAIPTIFNVGKVRKERTKGAVKKEQVIPRVQYEEKCRFCVENFEDEKIEITEMIRKQFSILTQMELRNSSVYSNFICKNCHQNLTFSVSYKAKLIEKQTRLYHRFEALEEKNNYKDDIFRVDIVENIKEEDEEEEGDVETLEEQYAEVKEENAVEQVFYEADCDQEQEIIEIGKTEIDYSSVFDGTNFDFSTLSETTAGNNTTAQETSVVEDDDYYWPEQQPQKQQEESINTVKVERKKTAKEREKDPVICQHCGGIFKRKSLHNHIQIVHFKIKRFTCDVCGYRSYLIREMRYHMMVHSQEKHCQCKECGKMFSTPITLSSHRFKVHRQQTERNFLCTSCGKSFRRKCDLNDHIKFKHMENKRFICHYDGCGKDFQNRSSFKDHLARHEGNQNLPCDQCGKFFYTDHQLKSHKAGHVKGFRCMQCDKQFANNRLLMLHHAIHEGKRQFACQFCSNRYFRKPHLVRHITSAHMNIKIKCEITGCASQFARKATYKNHIISHHKDLGEDRITELFQKIRELRIEINPNEFTNCLA